MSGLFLSYRRKDSGPWVERLHEHLAVRFGESIVWRDVDDIALGKDFLRQIRGAVARADAVLVIIGPDWLKGRRLFQPQDVLRGEVEVALGSRKEVVPVLVGGARMPQRRQLPESIAALPARQAATLRDGEPWGNDINALIEGLREIVHARRKPQPLRSLHAKLDKAQYRYFELLEAKQTEAALDFARAMLRLLDEQSPLYPQDPMLQLCRGYFLKNEFMALRDLGRAEEAEQRLLLAGRLFETLRQENGMRLAAAYNGIGSVQALSGEFETALRWIDAALALLPDYPAALEDRRMVLQHLGRG